MNDRDCVALLQWALPHLNHRWEGYRRVRRQVCRRIIERTEALGLTDMAAFRTRLEEDPLEWSALRFCLRVTISRFFRNRGVFHALEQSIFPALAELALKSGDKTLRIWSAGCASGEEPYSLSMLWALGVQARWPELHLSILATDVDAELLQRAKTGCYPESSLKEVSRDWVAQAFVPDNSNFCLRPEFRKPVRFQQQDLCEELPEGSFHLILCRNLAFTYFAHALQREIAKDLLDGLIPGGCMILGAHERLPAESESTAMKDETKGEAGIYWKCA
jgi:chemotaxis protein methyltransferase CheR